MSDTVAKILTSFEALRSELTHLGPGWSEDPESDFFCTLDWFENLAQHGFEAGDVASNVQLLFEMNPSLGLAACLPVLKGNPLGSLSNYYTSLFGPMHWVRRGLEVKHPDQAGFHQAAAEGFAALIGKQLPRLSVLRLQPMDLGAVFVSKFEAALASAGFWTDHYFCFGNWYLEVNQRSFDQYQRSLPSKLQHNIERGARRLSHQGQLQIDVFTDLNAKLAKATADFIAVYQQSWKPPEPRPDFIPGLIALAAKKGWLRLGILRLNGQPIAAQLWLVKSGKASIFKLAYIAGHDRLSPGTVLTARLMRHVIDIDKVDEVDYLTGDDNYKKDWMSHRRERWGLLAFKSRSIRGTFQAIRHFLGKAVRALRRVATA